MGERCAILGCDRVVLARGWCSTHYGRWQRWGSPEADVPPPRWAERQRLELPRFWSRVDFSNPDGCWLWKGAKRHAYGEVLKEKRKHYAHRVAYEMVYGPIAVGMVVYHRCDTPLCVRPDHLEVGTRKDNAYDMLRKGRASPPPLPLSLP